VTLTAEVEFATRKPWVPSTRLIARWATAAAGAKGRRSVVSVRIVTPRESEKLNGGYRGKFKPTNVLSFEADVPAGALRGEARPLGDLVICAHVVSR
jgi:probable rRNA maturation factor